MIPLTVKPLHIGIIGASTLKGKELKEAVEHSPLAALEVTLLDDETAIGKLEELNDEATFIQAVTDDSLAALDIAFFASDPALTLAHVDAARRTDCSVVDMSYALEGQPGFPVRSPWLEDETGAHPPLDAVGVVTAHPAATMLALLLTRLNSVGKIRVAAATALQPVSETGNAGMDELHQQTINLLNFQSMPKTVFDTQVAFNLVQNFGAGTAIPLERVGERIRQHIEDIAPSIPPFSVNVIGAPVFHGFTLSLFVEFDSPCDDGAVEGALTHDRLHLFTGEADPQDTPSNVNSAGEERIAVLWKQADMNPSAIWIWAAADNLKLTAITAVECARRLAALRTSGQIQ